MTKDFEVPDGEIYSFGKSDTCHFTIPVPELDDTQFYVMNFNGKLYLVDCSNEYPTRIKLLPGQKFILNDGDFINIGLEQDVLILDCKDTKPPAPGDDTHINIRWIDESMGAQGSIEYLKSPDRIGEPLLKLEGKQGDHDGEVYDVEKGVDTTIGRIKSSKIRLTPEGVSRKHAIIKYDDKFGWTIEE